MINTPINRLAHQTLPQRNNTSKVKQQPHFGTLYITQVKENADNIKKIGQELGKPVSELYPEHHGYVIKVGKSNHVLPNSILNNQVVPQNHLRDYLSLTAE